MDAVDSGTAKYLGSLYIQPEVVTVKNRERCIERAEICRWIGKGTLTLHPRPWCSPYDLQMFHNLFQGSRINMAKHSSSGWHLNIRVNRVIGMGGKILGIFHSA